MFSPDIIQVPYSVADRRLELSGYIKDLKRAKIEIHARSIFLQGLLLIEKGAFPKRFLEIEDEIMLFRESAKDSGLSVLEACIFTALRIKEFDKVLIGVTSANEFIEIKFDCIACHTVLIGKSDVGV